MCILYKKSFVKKFQLGDNKPKKNSKARVFQWFIELNPKRNQRQALGHRKCSLNRLRTHLRKYVLLKNAAKFAKDIIARTRKQV